MTNTALDDTIGWLTKRNANEPEFLQAAREILEDIWGLVERRPEYREHRIVERLLEPDLLVSFRVVWEDDAGARRVNRGYRVQTCNALGPYKGGLRFDPSVNPSILKFLGLEQTLKNSLTDLPIGSAKGGADLDPKDLSDAEIRRFCQAFMAELIHHIGPETDVPAGDIGVGAREIGYLFGQYKRVSRAFAGALTGKPVTFGGSELRSEATGFGVVYFAEAALGHQEEELRGQRCAVSGAGNVARFCARKLQEKDSKVVTLSDREGVLVAQDGLEAKHLDWLTEHDGRLEALSDEFDLSYRSGEKAWSIECDLAFPCATQNEIDAHDAEQLIDSGCRWVVEGANMPCDADALATLRDANVTVCPGKAANAGGVTVSALEMAQNASHQRWSRGRVDDQLVSIMRDIHERCVEHLDGDRPDYVRAANRAGFVRVADALVAQGV